MRVTLLGYGTRGDVQPQLALAMGLARRGHEVRVATNRAWSELADDCGVPIHAIDVDPVEMSKIWEEQQTELDQGWAWTRYVRNLRQRVRPLLRTFWDESVAACEDAELVIFSQLGFPGFHVAEARGIPSILAAPLPVGTTREFAAPWIAAKGDSFGSVVNRFTHLLNEFPWWIFRRTLNEWRRELGLGPVGGLSVDRRMERAGVPRLMGYSPVVVPRPADWGPRAHVTGFWFLPRVPPSDLPPELEAALHDDSSPIAYTDLGSMVDHLPPGGLDAVVEGVGRAGARLVLTLPERLSPPAGEGVIITRGLPHEQVFPRVDLVIHHAGAGTTGAVVRAGRPSVPVPVLGDQYMWAGRLHRLGIAPQPVRGPKLSADLIAGSVRQALAPAVRERAATVGRAIEAEDGVGAAVGLIERHAHAKPSFVEGPG
jgi:sterol 3beta-glucosyltransferase